MIVLYLNQLAASSPLLSSLTIFFAEYFPYLLLALFLVFAFRQKRNSLSISPLLPPLTTPQRVAPLWQGSRGERIRLVAEGFCAALVSRGLVEAIRLFVYRLRPFVADSSIAPLISEASFSFPSGHAAFFFALSTVIYLRNKRLGIWFYAASAVIGVARVAAGAHYPTDILGGAVLGIAVGLATHQLVKRYRNPFVSGEETKKTV